jgi:hypothetical protein
MNLSVWTGEKQWGLYREAWIVSHLPRKVWRSG